MRSSTKKPGRERENPFLLSSCTGSSRRMLISPAHASGSPSHGSERAPGEAPPRNSSLPSRRVACAALRSSLSEAQPRRAGQGALPAAREQLLGRLRIPPQGKVGGRAPQKSCDWEPWAGCRLVRSLYMWSRACVRNVPMVLISIRVRLSS